MMCYAMSDWPKGCLSGPARSYYKLGELVLRPLSKDRCLEGISICPCHRLILDGLCKKTAQNLWSTTIANNNWKSSCCSFTPRLWHTHLFIKQFCFFLFYFKLNTSNGLNIPCLKYFCQCQRCWSIHNCYFSLTLTKCFGLEALCWCGFDYNTSRDVVAPEC